ncbi:MAG: hypothetical protein PHH93_11310 [Prolixibacteraceae bacterium]|nr:hypothetical protein [Prolixibacteraceae bacterium]
MRFLNFNPNILSWDVFGYYLYLPAKFIYHDIGLIDQSWLNNIIDTYNPTETLYQATQLNDGNWVIKYWMGLSVLLSPLFFLAHFTSPLLGYPADGFSFLYQVSMTIAGLLYAFAGLYLFFKVLRHFFNRTTSCIVLTLIFFGTNYLHLTAIDGTLLTHNFLFTLYGILTFSTIKWYDNPRSVYALIIGISMGFIVLVRPSELVCFLIPLLWYNKDHNYISGKLTLFRSKFSHVVIALAAVFIVLLPQILYWKSVTGQYLFYSYTDPGEGLDLLSPHTLKFLFSFRKGWLVYTPLMIFAVIGFYYLYKKNKPVFIAVTAFVVFDIYLISSYTNWWYAGGSFSSRSLVPAYVLLAIPLGYFIAEIQTYRLLPRIMFILTLIFLSGLNLFQSWQFKNGIITKQTMTRDYYFAVFGKTEVPGEAQKLLLVSRPEVEVEEFLNRENYNRKLVYENDFDEFSDTLSKTDGVFVLDEENIYSPGPDIKFKDITSEDHAWITISTKVYVPVGSEFPLLVASFHYKGRSYKYRTRSVPADDVEFDDWTEITMDYLTPGVRTKNDNLKVYLWYRGSGKVLIDNLNVYAWERK